MKLIEVSSKKDLKNFIHLPVQLYKSEKNWIRHMDKDIENVFKPEKNNYYKHGDCVSWILEKEGRIIGRIAAFYDSRKSVRDYDQPTGGVGFLNVLMIRMRLIFYSIPPKVG